MAGVTGQNMFQNISTNPENKNSWYFRLQPTHVAYANTLRRLVITGVESVAFRADMTENGTTTDVLVEKNTTPMTNEMLAHRIGLLPIYVPDPLKFEKDKYLFKLEEINDKDVPRDVTCSDFTVYELTTPSTTAATTVTTTAGQEATIQLQDQKDNSNGQRVPTERFFPPNSLTRDTCLIATFKPTIYGATMAEAITLTAKASIGTGRENARFNPVSQCSYVYSRDTENSEKMKSTYEKWLVLHKKVVPESLKDDADRAAALEREFNTLEVAKVYLTDEKGEPYSFDFTVETLGILSVPYIIQRACEVGEAKCLQYANLTEKNLETVSMQPADARIRGFDVLFKGEDHTLGNLFQTWIEQNMVGKGVVTFAGYKIPHPLRDEMLLRIGVEDGKELTVREVIAQAARSCAAMFRTWKSQWQDALNTQTKRR
jgi:DNA-directed RNA polymerase subunit L/DNA-directed RNA polymerase alpha subunit